MKKTWGKHLIIDAYGIKEKKLKNRQAIKKLLGGLPEKFKMRSLSKVLIKKVTSSFYPEWGLSGFVMLYESHISLHTWPEKGYLAMDIYSCKDFDDKLIVEYLKKFWQAKKMKIKKVKRG